MGETYKEKECPVVDLVWCFAMLIIDKEVTEMASTDSHKALTESELLEKLEKSREHAAQGMFRDAEKVSRDIKEKYGL